MTLLAVFWLAAARWAAGADATSTFPNPLPAEQFVLTNLTNQGFIDLTNCQASPSAATNRTIRGKFLEWLLTTNAGQVSHVGLRLANAVVEGPVDLSNEEVPVQVQLRCCHFKRDVNLTDAHFDHDLVLQGCLFDGGFQASAMRVDGSFALPKYELNADWNIPSANPPTQVELTNYLATSQTLQRWSPEHGEFLPESSPPTRTWLVDDRRVYEITNRWTNVFNAISLGNALFLAQRYENLPEQVPNPLVGLPVTPLTNDWKMVADSGELDLNSIRAGIAWTLRTELMNVENFVLTTNAANSLASVEWRFDNPAHSDSLPLMATWLHGRHRIDSITQFCQHTVFRQQVSLDRAVIAGKFDAGEVEFRGELYAQSLKVAEDVFLKSARFDGLADFTYAQIGHDFQVGDSTFQYFKALGMQVGGSLMIDGARFRDRAIFEEVSAGIAFRGQYARFENREAPVDFGGLKVNGLVDFQRAQFAGPVNFILAHIQGNFQAQGATFADDHTFKELQKLTGNTFTFNADFGSMKVDGFAIFENALFTRSVSFRNAQFANLYLDGTHWPAASILATYHKAPRPNELLRLEGMDFTTIRDVASGHFQHTHVQLEESQTNLLAMFAERSPYSFDIYSKLESYFQREGAPGLADDVFVSAKLREGEEATRVSAKLLNVFLHWTVGYGRNPLLAMCESGGCILIWGALCQRWMVRKTPPKRRPHFGLAIFYSLGTFLPIIDLGAADLLEYRAGKEWFHYLVAVEKVLGYILVPLWTMALTGLIK